MKSSIGDRLWRGGVILAWVPIATAAATVGSDRPASSTTADAVAAVDIVGDTLVIEGTPEDDRILIKATREPDTVRVIFNGLRLGHFGPVARVEVDAGDGDDTVLVSGALELPVRLDGGPGADRLRGGAGSTAIRPDGGTEESTFILPPPRGAESRQGRRETDRAAVEWWSQVFSGTPALADDTEPGTICMNVSESQCLETLAKAYTSHIQGRNVDSDCR